MKSQTAWPARYWLALLVVLIGLWVFAQLAYEVLEGETHPFDGSLLLKMRNPSDPSDPLGSKWVEQLFRDITALGGGGVLTLVTLVAAGFVAMERKLGSVILLLVAVGGGVLLVSLLKLGFDRPRPDLVVHSVYVHMSSFPSGHSKLSAVTYSTLGVSCTNASAAMGENVPVFAGDVADLSCRDQPRVSGGTLADGRSGRLDNGSGRGTAMLVLAGWLQRHTQLVEAVFRKE